MLRTRVGLYSIQGLLPFSPCDVTRANSATPPDGDLSHSGVTVTVIGLRKENFQFIDELDCVSVKRFAGVAFPRPSSLSPISSFEWNLEKALAEWTGEGFIHVYSFLCPLLLPPNSMQAYIWRFVSSLLIARKGTLPR